VPSAPFWRFTRRGLKLVALSAKEKKMTLRIGINGFGRIGRVATRILQKSEAHKSIELVAVNDLTDSKTLAHLLKYDSVHGRYSGTVESSDKSISVDGKKIEVLSVKNPAELPWKDLGVDLVLECTGIFRSNEAASLHLKGGAKKVIVSAPSPDPDLTLAYGVNHQQYDPAQHHIISCASCTTNCLAPIAKVILDNFGIVRGTMTTIHSYTNDQRILDLPHSDLRRARAAGISMIPTTTGAAKAVGLVLPELKGKVDGFAVRVPTSNVSVVDFVAEIKKDSTAEEVNQALKEASQSSLKGILDVCEEPLVSIDFLGNQHSSIVDALSTMVIQDRMIKVISWYDNEVGFSTRMLDTCKMISESL